MTCQCAIFNDIFLNTIKMFKATENGWLVTGFFSSALQYSRMTAATNHSNNVLGIDHSVISGYDGLYFSISEAIVVRQPARYFAA